MALGTEDATIPNPVSPQSPPISVPPDPETLKEIADVPGGRAFTSDDAGQLRSIYSLAWALQLATKHEQREITPGFAGAGLVLLLAAGLLSLPRVGRLPSRGGGRGLVDFFFLQPRQRDAELALRGEQDVDVGVSARQHRRAAHACPCRA